ncbi:MAG TPA: 3-isopropylmalate dehydratase small subunit [Candidatus Binataceae bacterium]|nr:3-isopropylmalate dehydratase small subunit [Candidatus Binataceae bacterium]
MNPFKNFTAQVAPLDRANVDTDQIIPKQFLKAVVRSGLKKGLFFDWRLNPDGSENKDFVLNRARYRDAGVLVARQNFGSGSSREHAVWALGDFGIKAVIAPSFADIFHNNCFKNGLLPIKLKPEEVDHLMKAAGDYESYRLTIDLVNQKVSDDFGWAAHFEIDPFLKKCMLEGLDDIALTLVHEKEIAAYEGKHPVPYKAV